jgi:hexosaminidase
MILVLDFEVIPLIQTFGHVEFILKGPEYRYLREVDQDPQSFCPSKPGTMVLVREMVDQVLIKFL